MKKVLLALVVAGVMAGCASNSDQAPVNTTPVPAMGKVADGAFTRFAYNDNSSEAWIVHENADLGLGDVSPSPLTASGDAGSLRLSFPVVNENTTEDLGPAVSQIIPNISPDTDYVLTVYYRDDKGDNSANTLELGVKDAGVESLTGNLIRSKLFTNKDIGGDNDKNDETGGFRKVTMAFNSGSNTTLEVYVMSHLTGKDDLAASEDMTEQTQVFIDDISLEID
ncbi:MAG: hypothetical protein ACK5NC_06670 [Vibrio sp.]